MTIEQRLEQVEQALEEKFTIEEEHPVFWYDADGVFAEYVKGQLTCYAEA